MTAEEIFPIFFAIWVILGIFSLLIFFVSKNVERKKKLWPPFVIGAGILFLGFAYAMFPSGESLTMMVPAVVLITILNLRATKFCDGCGKMVINQNFFVPPKFCTKCGEPLV